MKRRDFLKTGTAGLATAVTGASGLLAWSPRAEAASISKTFYITDGTITQIDGTDVYFQGFSSSSGSLNVPGEHMIVQEGDTITITIHNTLSEDHSFVIDGMVDSGVIRSGDSKTVSFTASSPGTHFYYDSLNAPYNSLVGLHGGFAVMPSGSSNELYAGSKTFKQQYFWIFNDVDPAVNEAIRTGRRIPTIDNYVPRYFTLNGLSGRPPEAPGSGDESIDSMADPRSHLVGKIGDRALVRVLNAGLCQQSVHCHANHVEWLTDNGAILPNVWEKDCVYLEGDLGRVDVIYPFETPPDAVSDASTGMYPMHLHTEMSQTAAGGYYMFGAIAEISFK